MAPLTLTKMPAPHDGIDLMSAPDSMSPTRAPWMENFLIGNYGRLPVRAELEVAATNTAASALTREPLSLVRDPVTADTFWITRGGDTPITGDVRPDEIPYRVAAAKANLDVGTTTIWNGSTALTGANFFGRGATTSRSCWGFEYSSSTNQDTQDAPVLNGPRQWQRSLVRLSGGVATLFNYTQAPTCGIDVEVHNNLLWVLGGYPAAVTTEQWSSSCLFWTGGGDAAIWGGATTFGDLTDDGNLRYGTSRDWRNNSNVINRIEIPGSDNGKAIVRLGSNLVIFKERSIWILYGTDEDSYTLRNVTSEIGLWDRDSVVEADGGIYFQSSRGYEFFDGSGISTVSELIGPLFDDLRFRPFYFRRTTAGVVSNNYIEIRMENVAVSKPCLSMAVHRPTRNWTSFSGTYHNSRAAFAREGNYFTQIDKTVGTSQLEGIQHHIYTSLVDLTRSSASVIYRPVQLAGMTHRAQLHRAFLDTKASAFGNPGEDFRNVWTWSGHSTSDVRNSNGQSTPKVFTSQIPAQPATLPWSEFGYNLTKHWQGKRSQVDLFEEVDDIFFIVSFTPGTPNSPVRAELRTGGVEWSMAAPSKTIQVRESVPR